MGRTRVIHQEWNNAEVLLDVQHLYHAYVSPEVENMTVKAIDDVSFQIKKGEILRTGRGIWIRKIYSGHAVL